MEYIVVVVLWNFFFSSLKNRIEMYLYLFPVDCFLAFMSMFGPLHDIDRLSGQNPFFCA